MCDGLFKTLAFIGVATLIGAPADARAALREVEPGVFFEDFSDAPASVFEQSGLRSAEEAEAKQPRVLEVTQDGGASVLRLKGGFQTRVFYHDRPFKDFVLETTVKKAGGSYGGVVVRDHWRVYFQMKGYLCLNSSMPGLIGGQLFKSDKTYRGYHKLKVVCAGPLLHAYVDGEHVFSYDIPDTPGLLGFYAHGNGETFYQDIRIDAHVDPAAFLGLMPTAPGDSLVFAPGSDAVLTLVVKNHSEDAQPVTLEAAATDWEGKPLSPPARAELSAPRGETRVPLPLGRLPRGFHCVAFKGLLEGKAFVEVSDLPLAVQERGDGRFSPPVLPISAYSKYFNKTTPIYYNTYAHAVARTLREHGFNAIVADPFFTKEGIDIYQSYGIATIARSGAFIDHPAVIATLASDEPKPDQIDELKASYAQLAAASGKPVTTCMVGEGMGLGGDHDPVTIWRTLDAELRAFRWYGIKKSFYDLLYDVKYKGILPLASVLRIVEASDAADWWFVPPSFGRTDHEGYYKNPTPAQMRGLMHLAMAHGCDGLMLWSLQSHASWPALIDQRSLQPPDGKLEAAGAAARVLAAHDELLVSLRYGGFEVGNSNPVYVEAVPRRGSSGAAYVYVVNKDAANAAEVDLTFDAAERVKDIFSGTTYAAPSAGERGRRGVTLALGPCEAMLLDLGVTVPAPEPSQPLRGQAALPSALVSAVQPAVADAGVVVAPVAMAGAPCIAGDAIGLSRADDPRRVWKEADPRPRCLCWSGLLHGRTAEGYLPLRSALRLAEAHDAATPGWTAYHAVDDGRTTPGELRAMLHLALAYGSVAVLVPDGLAGALNEVVAEVSRTLAGKGATVASLRHAGLDIRCKNPMVAAVPRQAGEGGALHVYAVNLDTDNSVATELLLWDDVWDWTAAHDVFADQALTVNGRDEEGYLRCPLSLRPGEGKLIRTDAAVNKKK